MKPLLQLVFAFIVFLAVNASATTHYVDASGSNPTPPYTSWATAATNIQDAISVSGATDPVLVTNGIYQYGVGPDGYSRVYTVNAQLIQSVNGPAVTTIEGYQVPGSTNGTGAVRCAYLNGAMLSGFTLTGGATTSGNDGGGVYCANTTSCVISNCIITGNSAATEGGGVFSGTLVNCVLSSNIIYSFGNGGGADGSILINCLLVGNQSGYYGGGAAYSTLINCTVVSNTAASSPGGAIAYSTAKNSILYYNSPDNGSSGAYASYFTNCCVFPLPNSYYGANNLTNPPAFANPSAGNYQLSPSSPCINAGNNSLVTNSTDLAGNPRIVYGTVDIGAYESPYNFTNIHYVSLASTNPMSPYNGWTVAATNIQQAVNAAVRGDQIFVTNGLYNTGGQTNGGYSLTNRVAIYKAVTVQSINGPGVTLIQGNSVEGNNAIRCVYLTNGAALYGFTLTNGGTLGSEFSAYTGDGGGLLCESTKAVASNCVIIGCSAFDGGGAVGGTLNDCTIVRNSAEYGGGVFGALNFSGGLSNMLNGCIIFSNSAYAGGGAAYSVLNNSIITTNSAPGSEAGGVAWSALTNCLITANQSDEGGGAFLSTLANCTVVSNLANIGGGTYAGANFNCIIYNNKLFFSGSNSNYDGGSFSNCDTAPLPSGVGNITNNPAFINLTGGNFQLQSTSPCINSGNNAYIAATNDFAGNPRIVGGTVDIGAYEYQTPTSVISYAYLQQYGLPTDGSVDFEDLDGTGFTVDQDWVAGLNPTNSASVLAMLISTATNNTAGITVAWQSVGGILYNLQRATNFAVPSVFSTIQTNIIGQAGTTSYTDTAATNNGAYFYRVGVQ